MIFIFYSSGPSWLEIGSTIATLATAGAAFASYMKEEKNDNRYAFRHSNFFKKFLQVIY